MDTFNVPLTNNNGNNNSSSSVGVAYPNDNNNHNHNHHHHHHQVQAQHQQQEHHPHHLQQQQLQQQQQLLPQHHKDQMLAAGSSPLLPFLNYTQQHQEQQQQQQQISPKGAGGEEPVGNRRSVVVTDSSGFVIQAPALDGSQLDGGISLSGLCERIFESPNPHSSSSNLALLGGGGGGTPGAIQEAKTPRNGSPPSSSSSISGSGGGAVILESVTVPSFANLLFPQASTVVTVTQGTAAQPADSLNSIDPTLLQQQKSSLNPPHPAPPVREYHQLKPMESGGGGGGSAVSTSGFLSSLDFEVASTNGQKTEDNNNLADNQISTTTTTATTTSTANNPTGTRRSIHTIEELAASSKTTSPHSSQQISNSNNSNNNNSNSASTTQHQQQQHHHLQRHHSNSNLSSEDESMSEDEFGLEIDDQGGYQDTTSSHSQQSGGGGGGSANGGGGNSSTANLLNGSGNAGGNGSGGYMLLPPASSSSGGHLAGGVGGGSSGGHGGTSASSGVTGEAIDFKHLFEELCPVCGDKVSGYHYGLLTCESCKGFFKRTVQNKKVYTCVAERSCHIDKTQRKRCPYCRFQKCLEVGMKLEAVRADRMRGGRNKFGPMYKRDRARKLQVMRQRQLALQALRSSMGSDIKPTPLSPGYQQAYPNMNIKQEIQIPQVSSLTQSPDSSPSPIAIALGQVNASSGGGVIATPMNGGNGGGGGVVGGSGNGGGSVGNGNSNNNNNSSNNGGSSGGAGSGGGGGNGNSGDGLSRNGGGNGSGSGSGCHETGTGSLQNTAESKLCFDSGSHPSSTADALIEPLRVSPMIREFVQSIDDREWQTQLFALLQKQTYNQVEVDLFELMCKVLDQNLFSQVDWARNTVFFKDLKVDDQMKLLQHSWSDMLVLDHLHHRIHNGLPDETQLNNGQVFNLMSLGLLGVPQLSDYFNELQNKLTDLKFDMGDYVCMKFLILLNPGKDVRGIINKKTVLEGHENVQAALLDYTLTCYPSVNDKFRRLLNILPEIHAMAARGEEHLYSKHCAGSAPTQTLLMEMLHAKRKV